MVTRAKKTEYWILNTFPYNRILLRNMLIYTAKHCFRYRKDIEMRPIRNRVHFLTKFQIVSVLLKIAPYHMPKFGRYRKSSYLCTSNRRNSLSCRKPVIYEDPKAECIRHLAVHRCDDPQEVCQAHHFSRQRIFQSRHQRHPLHGSWLYERDAAVIKAIKEGKTNVDLNIPETPDGGGGDNISL